MGFIMQIFINGVPVDNFRIGKSDNNGFTEVFVNGNSSRHWLPTRVINGNSSVSFRVNGVNYKVTR